MSPRKLGTLAVHAGEEEVLAVPSVTTPVYQTTTYRFGSAAEAAAYLVRPEGRWLYSRLENRTVIPFLPSHPDHAVARRLLRGGGGVLSFAARGGHEAIARVHDALRIVSRASSLGGVESLASIPVLSSHRHATRAELAAQGIEPGLLRLSVGLEDPEDLLDDLRQALERA
ncbi:MAG TPA: PLP-dependent transferase [Anaeromyxobacteraceae bacterium]|nr:PLP-dependent transferase [Anaeromyxobacteraceae bacterium]